MDIHNSTEPMDSLGLFLPLALFIWHLLSRPSPKTPRNGSEIVLFGCLSLKSRPSFREWLLSFFTASFLRGFVPSRLMCEHALVS
jgi:hypothetical protein